MTSPLTSGQDAVTDFLLRLQQSLSQQTLHKLTFGNYRGSDKTLQKVTVKPVLLKGKPTFSFVHHHRTQDITKNHSPSRALDEARALLLNGFRSAYLLDDTGEAELKITAQEKSFLRTTALVTQAAVPVTVPGMKSHDRQKQRPLNLQRPWLKALGLCDDRGQVIPSMSHKWKQVNRFIEIFSQALEASGLMAQHKLRVMDFGSGKGYLTFATHDYLSLDKKKEVEVMGIELRETLVRSGNQVAAECSASGLSFVCGDILHTELQPCHIMIALHACDTATDDAIHYGIRSGASVLLCAPCCHKELRPQLTSPEVLKPLLKHGIHAGTEAEMITDTLRALWLESCGYDTKIFEFISLEHTDKNRMVLAIKRPTALTPAERQQKLDQISALKGFYGIRQQRLERLLTGDQ